MGDGSSDAGSPLDDDDDLSEDSPRDVHETLLPSIPLSVMGRGETPLPMDVGLATPRSLHPPASGSRVAFSSGAHATRASGPIMVSGRSARGR